MAERLKVSSRSPRRARRLVSTTLRAWELTGLIPAAELVVSELVANAVLHGGSGVEIRISRLHDRVRLEVLDTGPGLPVPRDAHPSDTGGRGLSLVAAVAAHWGVLRDATGKTVWCELPIP